MLQLSEQYSCGAARLRIDVFGSRPLEHLLGEATYLNYRLAAVEVSGDVTEPTAGLVWNQDAPGKSIRYASADNVLTVDGDWHPGELQKIVVSLLAQRMEMVGLHPFHSSAIRYREKTILFLGGEENHGKSMSQIEGSRRGGLVVSTETTVTDEQGWVVMGSKDVFLRTRSKGTERADKPDQDQGVAKFFDGVPEFVPYYEPCDVDLVVVPAIDGHFDTLVARLNEFESEYQTFHSLMNYLGLHQILAPGLAMPIIDSDDLRARRADFGHRFAHRPYFMLRARNPQILMDEVERLL